MNDILGYASLKFCFHSLFIVAITLQRVTSPQNIVGMTASANGCT